MRLIVGITFVLVGVATLSCHVEGTANPNRQMANAWVRTVDGWERPALWYATPAPPPQLHPMVLAAGQGLASILALAVFSRHEN